MQFLREFVKRYLAEFPGDASRGDAVRGFLEYVEADMAANPIVMFDVRDMALRRRNGDTLPVLVNATPPASGSPANRVPSFSMFGEGESSDSRFRAARPGLLDE